MIGVLIIFVLLVLVDIYIYGLFLKKYVKNIYLRILWFLPSAFFLASIFIFNITGFKHNFREIYAVIYIAITLPKILFTAITLFDLPLRYFFKWKIYPFTVIAIAVCIFTEFVIIYGSAVGKNKIELKKIEFNSPNLPQSFEGYKIVQISDLHLGNSKKGHSLIKKMAEVINEQQPDIVFVTGDLVHVLAREIEGYEDILSGIKAKDGVYSVLGNHDYGTYFAWENKEEELENFNAIKQAQTDLGWKLLNNEHILIHRGNDSIAVIGVENSGSIHFANYGDLPKAMQGVEKVPFKILLSHDPSHWRREVLNTDIDLMFSGHTHASQIAILGLSPAAAVYPEWKGMYMEENQGLYVNVGIGHVGIPFRFGAWPEVTVVELRKE